MHESPAVLTEDQSVVKIENENSFKKEATAIRGSAQNAHAV
jgi:hypothetical protein